MTKITATDRENLIDFLEIIEERGEEDAETLRQNAEMRRLLENGEAPLPSDAASLIQVAREFVAAWEEEPGADEDPQRADYTGLMDRLTELVGE